MTRHSTHQQAQNQQTIINMSSLFPSLSLFLSIFLDFSLIFQFPVQVLDSRYADHVCYMPEKQSADVSTLVIAPMPGIVKTVNVVVGQPVSKHEGRRWRGGGGEERRWRGGGGEVEGR